VRGVDVDVVYKDIKHLHIAVYPPLGRVRVSAPRRLDDERVRLAIVQRLPWIHRQRERLQSAVRKSEREMVSGESHYAWGVRRRLRVIERPGRAHVAVDGDRLLLYAPPDASRDARAAVLDRWQRDQLRLRIPGLIERWEPIVERRVAGWSIRRMKTRWGSCTPETGRIRLNVELATKHPNCLEYVLVHEMAHLRERTHRKAFTALMDSLLPDWHARRDELRAAPLADQRWKD
jgi:predicted metal-dependent hydrolase